MKKITLSIVFFIATNVVTAQQFYLEGGKTLSSFKYKNSQENNMSNLQATSHSYMELGYRNRFLFRDLNFSTGLSYSGYGAIASDDTFGNFMEWEANYLGLDAALDYQLLKLKKMSVYLKAGVSTAFFVQGTQTLNNSVINLKNNEDFDSAMATLHAGAGFCHPISKNLAFYAQYIYGKSADISKGTEELKFISHNVGFGLLIDISKKQSTEKTYN